MRLKNGHPRNMNFFSVFLSGPMLRVALLVLCCFHAAAGAAPFFNVPSSAPAPFSSSTPAPGPAAAAPAGPAAAQGPAALLSVDFYKRSCPNVDKIVLDTVTTMSKQSNVVTPSTLRLFAHDCFVEGCDASIMISSTGKNIAERDHPENNIPQQAFDTIVQAKKAVESTCPGVVSCADIIVMAARDSVSLSGGPRWEVTKGRRDGLVSSSSRVPGHLPGSDFNVTQLTQNFAEMNLTATDMVILSGAHTIGFSHCDQFRNRLYNFRGTKTADPTINPSFLSTLKTNCPQSETGPGRFQAFDVTSPFGFDNAYYKNLAIGQGLLAADQVLFTDLSTRPLVEKMAASQDDFFTAFVQAMIRMSNVGVKVGNEGEIRQSCTSFNPQSPSFTPSIPSTPSPSPRPGTPSFTPTPSPRPGTPSFIPSTPTPSSRSGTPRFTPTTPTPSPRPAAPTRPAPSFPPGPPGPTVANPFVPPIPVFPGNHH